MARLRIDEALALERAHDALHGHRAGLVPTRQVAHAREAGSGRAPRDQFA
jgi:hypothetical protein